MATGTTVRMGRTAVLDTGKMQIVVSEKRAEPYDLGVFTHCGIDPRRKKYVLIKSRQHFRAGFDEFFPSERVIEVDCPGLTTPMLVILTGVIGGTLTHGLVGLFLGPVVLSVFYDLVSAWVRERPQGPPMAP